jgi:hypothetical protein
MKLFSRFFDKSPPSAPAPGERIAVAGAALEADEAALRVAAVHELPDGETLRRLAGLLGPADEATNAMPAAVERAAQGRLARLIDEGTIGFAAFCAEAENRSAMFSVAALCEDPSRLSAALASVDDPPQVAQLVLESPYSRLRQLAAETVDDPALLRQLLKQVRGKDKNVYKILKQKSDALHAEERRTAEIASEVEALCASLERHSHKIHDALYAPAFEYLHDRWRSLTAQPSVEIQQRAEAAIEGCREVIAGHLRQIEQHAADKAAGQAAREERERARQAAEAAALARADAEAQLRNEAASLREAEEAARAQKCAAEERVFRQIGGLIHRANAALREGNTKKAAGLRSAIDEALHMAPEIPLAPEIPPHLTRQLQQLDQKLNELKQWKDYAVAPKRLELIEEMELLVGSMEQPKILADRIKALQEEWRTIGKGIASDAPAEWERFQRASQEAYRPCREYFEAQAKQRQKNLENRKAVLDRLMAFEAAQNAENPDWRLMTSVLREAPLEWRQYVPVDREAGRTIQRDFDESMGRLRARLDTWFERNVADKQSLITRARQLVTQEDSREAIDGVKRLQILWKETGPVPRDQDQPLWSEFRELCDAVYQKRQQAHAEYTAGLESNKVKAAALCGEAEQLAALSGPALLEGIAKIAGWRAAFAALDEMPRADARGLHDRFERAVGLCEARMAEQRLRDAQQSFSNLFEAGRHIRAYEWAVVQNAAALAQDALKGAETFIASIQHWPRGGLLACKEALANAGSASEAGIESRERALRTLCIRCEILTDARTPPEDEALRREFQVQRLVQGMGQGSRADVGEWDAMLLEWIKIGALSPAIHERLQERFMRCWARRPVRGPERSTFAPDGGADQTRRREGPGSKRANVR